jgi:hypothetical protein
MSGFPDHPVSALLYLGFEFDGKLASLAMTIVQWRSVPRGLLRYAPVCRQAGAMTGVRSEELRGLLRYARNDGYRGENRTERIASLRSQFQVFANLRVNIGSNCERSEAILHVVLTLSKRHRDPVWGSDPPIFRELQGDGPERNLTERKLCRTSGFIRGQGDKCW